MGSGAVEEARKDERRCEYGVAPNAEAKGVPGRNVYIAGRAGTGDLRLRRGSVC